MNLQLTDGIVHANYRIPSLDYSILLKLTLNLTKDMEQVAEMFRLMVFNILISNRDDHGFLPQLDVISYLCCLSHSVETVFSFSPPTL